MKVKFFQDDELYRMEDDVNKWLEEHKNEVTVKDVSFKAEQRNNVSAFVSFMYFCMISYEETKA